MATIVDIDGTLLMEGNIPNQVVIDYVNALPGETIIVTGRHITDRKDTVAALLSAGVIYSRLIMNPGSTYDTAEFKYKTAMKLKGLVNLAIDNNPTMREAYAKAGIKTKDPAKLSSTNKFWQIFTK
jgi:hydroxymethylpyrimidine pyrophosphatase-like HAD family hydrolase